MRLFTLSLAAILFTATSAFSQDMKPLDYAPLYKKLQVKTRVCKEVKYQGAKATDSTMVGVATFDAEGRMATYTEYFAGGRKMAEYTYSYDETGKMNRSTVSLVFNSWTPMEFTLQHDAKGRVISRELKEPISNFWQKETYTYKDNILVKSEQWYDVNGGLVAQTHKDYPASLDPHENSLTYLHNEHGLLMLHQLFNKGGKVEKALAYSYGF